MPSWLPSDPVYTEIQNMGSSDSSPKGIMHLKIFLKRNFFLLTSGHYCVNCDSYCKYQGVTNHFDSSLVSL